MQNQFQVVRRGRSQRHEVAEMGEEEKIRSESSKEGFIQQKNFVKRQKEPDYFINE